MFREWLLSHDAMSVEMLLQELSDWVRKGYVEDKVWKGLSEFVSQKTIISALSRDEFVASKRYIEISALRANHLDRMLSHVSQYVYPSELKEFAVKRLGLRETAFEMIEEDHIYAKRRNFEVNVIDFLFQISIFIL